MASQIAARRAAKANRRKAKVAEKRRVEQTANSLASRVAAAAEEPIQHCLLTEGWAEGGMASLFLTRGVAGTHLTMATFLIDTLCLGVKDIVFTTTDGDALEFFLEVMDGASPLMPVDPAYARKLLRDVAAWAGRFGFQPHRNYATVERLFGSVDANACTEEFQFGRDGRPLYIPGPVESAKQVQRRMEQFSLLEQASEAGPVLEGTELLTEG